MLGKSTGPACRQTGGYVYALGFLLPALWADRQSSIFGVWAASAAPKTIPRGWGRSPPPFGMVFGAAGAAQTPKIDDFRSDIMR